MLPSPISRRVGVHIAAFEACSNFTRVTARQIARPPRVSFVARFRSARLPELTARQLSNLTINYSSGSFPHWYSAHLGHTRNRLSHPTKVTFTKVKYGNAQFADLSAAGFRRPGVRS